MQNLTPEPFEVKSPQRRVIEAFFRIPRKQDGMAVNFNFNATQAILDRNKTNRDIVAKARQEGISSEVDAEFTVDCGVYENIKAVVISHESDATQRLLQKVHFYVNNLRNGLRFKTKYASKNELMFEGTGSSFYIGTAGAKRFGRGDTIHRLHISELAFFESTELLTGLFQSVPYDGRIVIESTSNGIGNRYYDEVQKALKGQGRFRLHFFPWNIFPEYTLPVKNDFTLTSEELQLVEQYNLTPGQILWRRMKIDELGDVRLFQQEYPLTIDESFIATGWGFFPEVKLVPRQGKQDGHWVIYEDPIPGELYSMGIDAASGLGNLYEYTLSTRPHDDACLEIVKQSNCEQVAEFVSNQTSPDVLEEEAYKFGLKYNTALLVPEMNSYGLEVLNRLKKSTLRNNILTPPYPTYRIFSRRKEDRKPFDEKQELLGWQTNERSKMFLATDLRVAIREGMILHSEFAINEFKTFIEDKDKRVHAEEGKKDDCVIALGLAIQGLRTLPQSRPYEIKTQPNQGKVTMKSLRDYIRKLRRAPNLDDGTWPNWPSDLRIWPTA